MILEACRPLSCKHIHTWTLFVDEIAKDLPKDDIHININLFLNVIECILKGVFAKTFALIAIDRAARHLYNLRPMAPTHVGKRQMDATSNS